MRGRSTATAMPSHRPPPDSSRRHSATRSNPSSSSRRDVHHAYASADLTHANYNRRDDDDLPKILQHPFYLWSALFFLATYLCNHATFPRLRSSSSIGGGGGMRYRYNRQRPQTTTPDVDADVGTDSSGTASIDVSTIQRPDLVSLGLTDADGSGSVMKKPLIGVTTCASSRNWEHLPFQSMSLSRMMLPSLLGTMESDRFRYRLYVGIDDTDSFWNSGENQDRLRQMAGRDEGGGSTGGTTGGTTGGEGLEVVFHSFPQPSGGHRIPLNEICREAYVDGADYIVRINDDTEFVTPYWTSLGVRRLRSFQPPNVGVVGPTCHQGNREILTHDMVHRTHVDIFGTYYPKDFKNWYVDDWISQVYDKERTRMLGKWEVKHHIGYHGTRYEAHTPDVDGAVVRDKRILQEWLRDHAM